MKTCPVRRLFWLSLKPTWHEFANWIHSLYHQRVTLYFLQANTKNGSLIFKFDWFPGHLLQLNGTKLYDKVIRVEPARNSRGGKGGRVSIPSMLPPSYVMPIPQLANYGYGGNQNQKGWRNRRRPQGPSDIVKVPEDKVLQLIDVGVNLPNKA